MNKIQLVEEMMRLRWNTPGLSLFVLGMEEYLLLMQYHRELVIGCETQMNYDTGIFTFCGIPVIRSSAYQGINIFKDAVAYK